MPNWRLGFLPQNNEQRLIRTLCHHRKQLKSRSERYNLGGRNMHFKLIIALVDDDKTKAVIDAAREAGSTGATIIGNARGEGIKPIKSFFG